MAKSKKNSKKQQSKRVAALPVLLIHGAVAILTLRDIGKRPVEQVRGPKALWRFVASLNTGGAVAYWILGRKKTDAAGGTTH